MNRAASRNPPALQPRAGCSIETGDCARRDVASAPVKTQVDIDAVAAVDIRVGTIVEVGDVSDSNRLVRLQVDFGDFRRTILAGMKKERDDPREVEGRQALSVVNQAPRSMAGLVSEGMLFDIGCEDGLTPVLAVPERPLPNGARAG